MDEDLHNIDDLFKKALDDHEEMPSQTVWENIDKSLDKKKVIFISKKYNKLKWIAAALLIFSAGMAMYTWHTKMKNKELVKQNTANSKKEIENNRFKKNTNKNIDSAGTILNQLEEADAPKDTLPMHAQTRSTNPPAANKDPYKQNEKEDRRNLKDREAISNFFKQNNLKNLVDNEKRDKHEEKYLSKGSDRLAESNDKVREKKAADNLLFQEDRQSVKTKIYAAKKPSETIQTEAYKHIPLETELQKQDLKMAASNASLQNLLATRSEKQKITPLETSNVKKQLKTSKKPLFSATVLYSPDFVSSRINNDHHDFREDDRNEIKEKEKIKNSSTVGVLVNYNAGKKFSIESGLTYSSMTTDISPKKIYARPDSRGNVNYRFNCSAGYSYIPLHSGTTPHIGDSTTAFSSKNTLHYICVPLGLRYNMNKGKFTFSPGAGIAINFLTKGKIETEIAAAGSTQKANINNIEGLNSMYLNSNLSFGINYNINQNLAFGLTPAMRLALTSINKDAPVKTFLNSYGIALGMTIKL